MHAYRRELLIALGLVGLTLVAFEGVRHNEFVGYDDQEYITNNLSVATGLSVDSVASDFTTFKASNWHPLTWLSLQLDYQLFGPNPLAFHGTNLLLHVANVILLFGVLVRMTKAIWHSAAVAAVFAVHPLRVESVAWAAERKDVLSTLFWMLSLWAYAAYVARPSWQRYLWVFVSLGCGLLAKPMLVTLPCVLLLLDYWPLARLSFSPAEWHALSTDAKGVEATGGAATSFEDLGRATRPLWWLIVEKLPLFALVLAASVVTLMAQKRAMASVEVLPFASRVANALLAASGYLGKMLWPFDLAVFYPIPERETWGWRAAAVGGVLAAITAVAVLWRRQHPYFIVGWLWYLGTLVPVSGLVQVGAQAMADRYTYVPLIGIYLIFAWGVPEALGHYARSAVLAATACALVGTLIILTRHQVETWRDSLSLWEHAYNVTEGNYLAHFYVAEIAAHNEEWEKAKAHYEKTLEFAPRHPDAHVNLGVILQREGQLDAAGDHFLAAIHFLLQPDQHPVPYHNLGMVRHAQGRLDEAVRCYESALKLDSKDAPAHRDLGLTLTMLDRLAESRVHLAEALRLEPSDALANSHLGMVFAIEAEPRKAIPYFRRAVELDADTAQYRSSLAMALREAGLTADAEREYAELLRRHPDWPNEANAAAQSLAMAPNPGWRSGRLAIQLSKQACQAVERPPAEFLDTMAAAYAEAGLFDKAIATAREALRLASTGHQQALARQIEERLRLYERRQPYHVTNGSAPELQRRSP